jgi:hypothetical protein
MSGPNGSAGGAFAGGLEVDGGTVSLTNATVADNSVASGGSGGALDVAAGTVTLYNSLVALNTNGTGISAVPDDIAGTVSPSSAFNLIGTGGSGGLTNGVDGNQVGVADPVLGTLAANGGPTQTIALLPGSPAIGAGSSVIAGVTVPTTDQRGVIRPSSSIDIGAFQDRGFKLAIVAGSSPQRTAVNTAFPNPLTLTVTSPHGDPVAGGVISFSATSSRYGATATLSATTATIAANGQASVTATANGTQGKYRVMATASGQTKPAAFSLANTAGTNGASAAEIGGPVPTGGVQNAVARLGLARGDPASGSALPGVPQVRVTLDPATTLPAGARIVSGSTGINDGSVRVPLRNGTAGQSLWSDGRAIRAPAERPAPRAEVRLASRGRGWSLGATRKAKAIGFGSAEGS